MRALNTAGKVTFLPDDSPFGSTLISVDKNRPLQGEEKARLLSTRWLPQEKPVLRESFPSRLIGSLGVPKERGVWNSQGGRKDKLFSFSTFLRII